MLTFKIEVSHKHDDQTFHRGVLRLNGTPILYGDSFTDKKMCYDQMMQTCYTLINDLKAISDNCWDNLKEE